MATMQFYLLTTNIYAVLVRFLSGMVTPSVWIWSGASVLGMLLGVFLGRLVYSRVKLEMLKQWIYVFIALMGPLDGAFPLPEKLRLSKRESVL